MPTNTAANAIQLLKQDHDTVKALFDQFEATKDAKARKAIVEKAVTELNVHAAIEEEIFYPAVRNAIVDEHGIMNESDEEHHVAKVLIAELEEMTGAESHFNAKFHVLAENVRHHIEEEEEDMFPAVEKTDLDLEALGAQLLQRKQQLLQEGVPPVAEVAMVEAARGEGDSPAANSHHTVNAAKRPR